MKTFVVIDYKTRHRKSVADDQTDGRFHNEILVGYFSMLEKIASKAKRIQQVPFKLTE